jgi:hypothetical protein
MKHLVGRVVRLIALALCVGNAGCGAETGTESDEQSTIGTQSASDVSNILKPTPGTRYLFYPCRDGTGCMCGYSDWDHADCTYAQYKDCGGGWVYVGIGHCQ